MIDWWLLVSINIMIVTMGFHTFVAHQVSKATKRYIPSTPFLSIAEKNSYLISIGLSLKNVVMH